MFGRRSHRGRGRSRTPHCHARTSSGFGPSLTPQAEQTCDVGSNRPTCRNSRPYSSALYSSIATNADQPASCTDFASRVRASPRTAQVLHVHRLVIADDGGGELVVEVPARVRDVRVRPRDLHAGPVPVAAAVLLAGQVPLRPLSFFSARRRNSGAATFGAVVEDREMGQAEVDAALAVRLGQRVRARLDDERGEIPSCRVADHRDRGRRGRHVAGPADGRRRSSGAAAGRCTAPGTGS